MMQLDIAKLRARLAEQGCRCLYIPLVGHCSAVDRWGQLRFASIEDLNTWIATGEVPKGAELKTKEAV